MDFDKHSDQPLTDGQRAILDKMAPAPEVHQTRTEAPEPEDHEQARCGWNAAEEGHCYDCGLTGNALLGFHPDCPREPHPDEERVEHVDPNPAPPGARDDLARICVAESLTPAGSGPVPECYHEGSYLAGHSAAIRGVVRLCEERANLNAASATEPGEAWAAALRWAVAMIRDDITDETPQVDAAQTGSCDHDYRPAATSESGQRVIGRRCAKCDAWEPAQSALQVSVDLAPARKIAEALRYGATCPVSAPGGDLAKDMLEGAAVIDCLVRRLELLNSGEKP